MSAYYGTDARVIASREWADADRILTFFTKEFGRLEAVAKGVRLVKSKLKGHLSLFSHVRIMVIPSRGSSERIIWRLIDAEEHAEKRVSHKTIQLVQEFIEFMESIVVEREQSDELWGIIERLHEISSPRDMLVAKIHLLRAEGMLPDEGELELFFSPKAVNFIRGGDNDSFPDTPNERSAFDAGIQHIVRANHVV